MIRRSRRDFRSSSISLQHLRYSTSTIVVLKLVLELFAHWALSRSYAADFGSGWLSHSTFHCCCGAVSSSRLLFRTASRWLSGECVACKCCFRESEGFSLQCPTMMNWSLGSDAPFLVFSTGTAPVEAIFHMSGLRGQRTGFRRG